MNDPRKWMMVAEASWLVGLGLVLGIHWPLLLWPLALYTAMGFRRWSPTILIAFLAGGMAGAVLFSHLPLVLVTGLALWRGFSLSRNDFLDMRFPFVWGILGSVAEFIARPAWGWIPLLLVVGFSLIAMVPYGRRPLLDRWSFAFQLLIVGIGAGLAASALVWLTPWGRLLRAAFYLVATPITWLLHFIPFSKLKIKHSRGKPSLGKVAVPKIPHSHQPLGPNHWIGPVLIGLGVLVALGLLFLLWRHLTRNRQPEARTRDDSAIIHEHIDQPVHWFKNPFAPLPPVRAQVRRILQDARKHGQPRSDAQTFPEWARATHHQATPAASLGLYDEVRYGDRQDTREAADLLRQSWPEWPPEERPNLAARLLGRPASSPRRSGPS